MTGKATSGDYDVNNLYRKIPTQITFTKEEIKLGEKLIENMGARNKNRFDNS